MEQREIRAVYTNDTIRVYQAYSKAIAKEAAKLGTFGANFSMNRMTWIKPSFLDDVPLRVGRKGRTGICFGN